MSLIVRSSLWDLITTGYFYRVDSLDVKVFTGEYYPIKIRVCALFRHYFRLETAFLKGTDNVEVKPTVFEALEPLSGWKIDTKKYCIRFKKKSSILLFKMYLA